MHDRRENMARDIEGFLVYCLGSERRAMAADDSGRNMSLLWVGDSGSTDVQCVAMAVWAEL